MTVKVKLPNGGDTGVNEKSVFVIRPATPSEKKENPQVLTTIWTGSTRIYPAETLDALETKFSTKIPLVKATAPNGVKILVHAASVVDADPPGSGEAPATATVLYFDPKPHAPRQGVREGFDALRALWAAAGQPTDIFD